MVVIYFTFQRGVLKINTIPEFHFDTFHLMQESIWNAKHIRICPKNSILRRKCRITFDVKHIVTAKQMFALNRLYSP